MTLEWRDTQAREVEIESPAGLIKMRVEVRAGGSASHPVRILEWEEDDRWIDTGLVSPSIEEACEYVETYLREEGFLG